MKIQNQEKIQLMRMIIQNRNINRNPIHLDLREAKEGAKARND